MTSQGTQRNTVTMHSDLTSPQRDRSEKDDKHIPQWSSKEINAAGIIPQVLCGYISARISEFRFAADHPPTLFPPV